MNMLRKRTSPTQTRVSDLIGSCFDTTDAKKDVKQRVLLGYMRNGPLSSVPNVFNT